MRLLAIRTLTPLYQGELDGLCGLYAIINAIRLVMPARAMRHADIESIFRTGIAWLDDQGRLRDSVRSGLGQTAWRQLASHVIGSAARPPLGALKLTPLLGHHDTAPGVAFDRIAAAIARQQPVLALLREAYHHYTVIVGVGATRLTLFDSYGYQWLERRSCSFKRQAPPTRHRFAPRSLLALQWQPAP